MGLGLVLCSVTWLPLVPKSCRAQQLLQVKRLEHLEESVQEGTMLVFVAPRVQEKIAMAEKTGGGVKEKRMLEQLE